MRLKGIDLYHTDRLLSENEKMIRDTVRKFVDTTLLSIINKHKELKAEKCIKELQQ